MGLLQNLDSGLDWTVNWIGLWTGLDCGLDWNLDSHTTFCKLKEFKNDLIVLLLEVDQYHFLPILLMQPISDAPIPLFSN